MTAVPRFYQNLFTKINMNFEKQLGFKKNNKSNQSWEKLLKKEQLTISEKIVNFLCEKLVRKNKKSVWRQPGFCFWWWALDQNIGEFLNAVGLPTLQGYGLTEASPVVSCNLPDLVKSTQLASI